MTDEKAPFLTHLEELRKRLIIIAIAIGIGFSISFYYAEDILLILKRPFPVQLQVLAPTEAFMTTFKVSFFAGVFLAMPVILHQIWKFVVPGLREHERENTVRFVISATLLFFTGAGFCYFVILPFGLKFLTSYASRAVDITVYRLQDYVSFVTKMMLAFGAIFELPIVILFLAKIGVVTPEYLGANRKYALLIIFIVAAILTPTPDIFNQALMAGPLMILYEVSILAARVAAKRARKAETAEKGAAESERERAETNR